MNMTLQRLSPLAQRAARPTATVTDKVQFVMASEQRRIERGPSKLARRLTRKVSLGRAGAF